jgi:AcrR family transcriptional regulator
MPRKPDPERRPEILDAIVNYIAEHGISDLSLRPLAKALGQSTFVLTYHFGDKDGLVEAALEHFETRQREMLVSWTGWTDEHGLGETIRRFWRWMLTGRNIKVLRVGFEMATAGAGSGFARRVSQDWVEFVAAYLALRGMDERTARRDATVHVATINGLLLDYMTTGDRKRVNAALDHYASTIDVAV